MNKKNNKNLNKNNNNKNLNKNKNFIIKSELEKNFIKKYKNKKLCDFYKNIFINKILYKCIYPDNIEKDLKKIIS